MPKLPKIAGIDPNPFNFISIWQSLALSAILAIPMAR